LTQERIHHLKADEGHPRASGEGAGVQLLGETTQGFFSLTERFLPPHSQSVLPSKEGQVTLYVVAGSIAIHAPDGYAGLVAHQGDILHFPTGERPLYANSAPIPGKVLEQVFLRATSQRFVPINAAEGRFLAVISDVGAVKLAGEHTHGAYLLMEWSVPTHGGVALHAQSGQETFYVIRGQFLFRGLDAGREQYELHAGPGDILHVPERVPHAYHNEGEVPGRMLVLTTPAGKAEHFFEEIGTPVPDAEAFPTTAKVPDPAALMAVLQRYQVEIFP
jgi:quercetin dioxygenase-like cupin family protein